MTVITVKLARLENVINISMVFLQYFLLRFVLRHETFGHPFSVFLGRVPFQSISHFSVSFFVVLEFFCLFVISFE